MSKFRHGRSGNTPDPQLASRYQVQREVGRLLGVGRCRAWELARAGLLPAIRLGRRWYVPRRALDALVTHALEQTQEALARQGERR